MPELTRRHLLAASALLITPASSPLWAAGPGEHAAAPGGHSGAPGEQPSAGGATKRPIVLCWNENPYGPSPAARAALAQAIPLGCRYPDEDIAPLQQALAAHHGVKHEQVVIGTGSGELLRALGLRCAQGSGELIVARPTYGELPEYAHQMGASVRYVPVDNALRHDLGAMSAAVSARTRAVYLCNPNNPTGTALPAAELEEFITALPPHVTAIVDEAYIDFADGPDLGTVAGLIQRDERVVVLRTFSKIHGMAGVRCGYALAAAPLAAELTRRRMTSPSEFAMRAARASLGDRAFLASCRRRILASRARIGRELAALHLTHAEPQGNFVFFDTGAPLTQFTAFMQARGILVGRLFPPYERWCRITIGTEHEVDAFLQELRNWRSRLPRAA